MIYSFSGIEVFNGAWELSVFVFALFAAQTT